MKPKNALLAVSLLGTLACLCPSVRADEFTVGHTGADLAASQYGVTGTGITVAIVDSGVRANDKIATYSSRGPSRLDFVLKPDIVAPGNQLVSLCASNTYLDNNVDTTNDLRFNEYQITTNTSWSSTYFRLSGTSMTPSGGWDVTAQGAGYLNISAALASMAVATKPANSPSLYRDTKGNVLVNGSQVIWGTQVIWGVSGVNILQVIWGNQVIWATQVIWGSSTVDLTNAAINGES